jgi:pimeloyl-ACP methyl ester carboxylesterase
MINQEKLIFKPKAGFSESLEIWGTKHHALSLEGGERAHFFEKTGDHGILIYHYGNAFSADDCLDKLRWLSKHTKLSLFVADYPGYGNNPGEAGQDAIIRLMEHWWTFLEKNHGYKSEQRYVWGHSLGGAIAGIMAGKMGCKGLILESTFNNMIDMAGSIYPMLPIDWICRHPFECDQALEQTRFPILMFHCRDDNVVPIELGKKLFSHLGNRAHWVAFEKGGHNQTYRSHGVDMAKQLVSFFPETSPIHEIDFGLRNQDAP